MRFSSPRGALVTLAVATAIVLPVALIQDNHSAQASEPVTPAAPANQADTAFFQSTAQTSVGALFPDGLSGRHNCTAGVVDSPAGDVIVTAAHCISGTGVGTVFAPGYLDGRAPYGTWTVTAAYAAPGWLADQDPTEDYVFLVVAPTTGSTSVQAVVGGSKLAPAPAEGRGVEVSGYPGSSNTPVSCTAEVFYTDGYPGFACDGFAGGTSGSPFLTATVRGGGLRMVGLIGGLHQGGCTDDVSYSSPFDSVTAATYRAAVEGGTPSVLPTAGSDGC